MMLFKLSLRNIHKSFKDYAIYFLTLILGVAIFYVFNAIGNQAVLLNVTERTYEIIDLMVTMLSGVSVFVSIVLGALIVYASRFLMKRRGREFGIYLTLGMSKSRVAGILLIETFIIGVVSLLVGLGLGVVLSQLMSAIVASMFEADMTNYTFVFSAEAFVKTLAYFGIMYVLVMILSVVSVGRCRLIDLLDKNKKSEKIKLKNPIVCGVVLLVSILMLAFAYYAVTAGINEIIKTVDMMFVIIVLGIVATFLLFWALSGVLLRLVMSCKRIYFRGLNSFTARQISSKVNTMSIAMATISLMLFMTICILSSALSLKNAITANLESLAPADIMVTQQVLAGDPDIYNNVSAEIIERSKLSVSENLESWGFDIDEDLAERVEVEMYSFEDFTFGDSLGDKAEELQDKYTSMMPYSVAEEVMTLSDYNKLAKIYGREEFELSEDEYLIVADYDVMTEIRDEALASGVNIEILGFNLKPKFRECQDGIIALSSNHINIGVFVVPDKVLENSEPILRLLVGNYNAEDKAGKEVIERRVMEVIKTGVTDLNRETNAEYLMMSLTTKMDIVESSVGLGALVTFLGLYLGIVFLIACVAILALRELSDSTDNRERYDLLRRLGADEKMIRRSLFRQILVFFLLPLVVAIVHSIFGIIFCNYIIATFGNEQLLLSILMTAVLIVVVYGGYFVLTYQCSKNIIRARR